MFLVSFSHKSRPLVFALEPSFNVASGSSVTFCVLVGVLDPFLAFGVLACRILDCASWLCGLLSDKLCCLRLKLELLAFGILRNYCESLSMFSSFVSAGVEFHVLASFLVCWLDGCASLGKLRCLS